MDSIVNVLDKHDHNLLSLCIPAESFYVHPTDLV